MNLEKHSPTRQSEISKEFASIRHYKLMAISRISRPSLAKTRLVRTYSAK